MLFLSVRFCLCRKLVWSLSIQQISATDLDKVGSARNDVNPNMISVGFFITALHFEYFFDKGGEKHACTSVPNCTVTAFQSVQGGRQNWFEFSYQVAIIVVALWFLLQHL
jgi:hypothetical protein